MTSSSNDISSTENFDVDAYNLIVANAQLQDIRLINSEFKVKPGYFSSRMEEHAGLNHAFNMASGDVNFDEELGLLMCQMDWSLVAKQGRTQLLKFTANYLIFYSGVPNVDERYRNNFMQRVGKFATYPYFRNFVSQISWASSAELPILPVLKQDIPPRRD